MTTQAPSRIGVDGNIVVRAEAVKAVNNKVRRHRTCQIGRAHGRGR
jgi:hypothetical protein